MIILRNTERLLKYIEENHILQTPVFITGNFLYSYRLRSVCRWEAEIICVWQIPLAVFDSAFCEAMNKTLTFLLSQILHMKMELTVTLSYKVLVEQTKTLRVHLSVQEMPAMVVIWGLNRDVIPLLSDIWFCSGKYLQAPALSVGDGDWCLQLTVSQSVFYS